MINKKILYIAKYADVDKQIMDNKKMWCTQNIIKIFIIF